MTDSSPIQNPLTQPEQVVPSSYSPSTGQVNKTAPLKTCDTCVRGGFPLKKEVLSLVVILLIGLATVLFVLLINEKRKILTATQQKPSDKSSGASQPVRQWQLPTKKMVVRTISLPNPVLKGTQSVEAAIATRRSRRTFAETPISLKNLSQILWSAQGITDLKNGYRTVPSGMSAYPFTVYVVVRNVDGVEPGLYEYLPEKNQLGDLEIANAGDLLSSAGVQAGAQQAPVVFLLSASPAKTAAKLKTAGADPMTDVLLEAGHIGQNMYLQVENLGMSMVVMGGFNAQKVGTALTIDSNEEVVYLIPVGNRAVETSSTPSTTSTKLVQPTTVKPGI